MIHTRAFSLTSIGLLLDYNKGQLLSLYLDAVTVQFAIMLNKPYQDMKIQNIAVTLQQVLVDIYYLFFYPHSDKTRCLLTVYEDYILDGVVSSVRDLCVTHDASNSRSTSSRGPISQTPSKSVDSANIENSTINNIETDLQVFDAWLDMMRIQISSKCNDVLERLNNASEIAKLQQLVYNASTQIKVSTNLSNENVYNNIDFKHDALSALAKPNFYAAYHYLLNPKNRHHHRPGGKSSLSRHLPPLAASPMTAASAATISASSSSGSKDNSIDIWELFFLNSFQQQILKMLQKTCELSVAKIQHALSIDHFLQSFSMYHRSDSHNHTSSHNRNSSGSVSRELSSSQIYKEAEKIVSLIQTEFQALFQASLFGSSADIFCFGLYVVATRLASNLMILCRSAIFAITSAIKDLPCTDSSYKPYLSCLLLMGRVTYLIQSKFEFFTSLFSEAGFMRLDGETNLPWKAFHNFSYIDDVSIKSAFEIADTNGDGLLSFSEYIEALNALGTNPIHSEKFDSISLMEFTMLCSHFSLVRTQDSLSKLKLSATSLSVLSHSQWASYVSKSVLSTVMTSQQQFSCHQKSIKNRSDLVAEDSDLNHVNMTSVHHISSTMLRFLYFLSHQFYLKILSIDAVQAMHKSTADSANNSENVLDSYFINLLKSNDIKPADSSIRHVFNDGLVESVNSSSVYEAISTVTKHLQSDQETLLNNGFLKACDEHKCMQMIFDMMCLESILQATTSSKKISNSFSELLISTRAMKSQLQMHLSSKSRSIVDTEFKENTKKCLSKISFLIGIFLPATDKITQFDSTNKSAAGNNKPSDQREQAIQTIFSSTQCTSRLSALPLPLRRNN